MALQVGGLLCPVAGKFGQANKSLQNSQTPATMPFIFCEDADENNLMRVLAQAVEEYKDKILRGLNHMTDAEFEEKIAEFKAFFYPENGTPEEMEEFQRQFALFMKHLEELRAQPNEMLITTGGKDENYTENDSILGFMQSRVASNPGLQQQLQTIPQ